MVQRSASLLKQISSDTVISLHKTVQDAASAGILAFENEKREKEKEGQKERVIVKTEKDKKEFVLAVVRFWCAQAKKFSPLYLASKEGDLQGVQALLQCTPEMVTHESESVKRMMRESCYKKINKKETKNVRQQCVCVHVCMCVCVCVCVCVCLCLFLFLCL